MATPVETPTADSGLGTIGFAAPEQEAFCVAEFSADVYSLGATLFFLASGVHPKRLRATSAAQRRSLVSALVGESPIVLREVIAACVESDPGRRPSLSDVTDALAHAEQLERRSGGSATPRNRISPLQRLRSDARDHAAAAAHATLHKLQRHPRTNLWLSAPLDGERRDAMALHRSTNRGVAGVLYALARLSALGVVDDWPTATRDAGMAADWLLAREPTDDEHLPGLHFGEAGVALALSECFRVGLLQRGPWWDAYVMDALAPDPDWPDHTHGAAGQLLACLMLAAEPGHDALLVRGTEFADHLVSAQSDEGYWELPGGVSGLEGRRYTGFAHGAAGIVYALSVAAKALQNSVYGQAAARGAAWIQSEGARLSPTGTLYPVEGGGTESWRRWCHGSPGVALAYLSLQGAAGEGKYGEVAIRCALDAANQATDNLSQCCGLAGVGEVVLDAFDVAPSEALLEAASAITQTLLALSRSATTRGTWSVSGGPASADFMVGGSGVAHYLARFADPDTISPPLRPRMTELLLARRAS